MKIAAVVLPVVGGIASWFYVNARAVLSYNVVAMRFRQEDLARSGIIEDGDGWSALNATQIQLRNRSLKHLSDVKVFYRLSTDKFHAEVSDTESVAREAISISQADGSLQIAMSELPRGETLTINLIARGYPSSLETLRGGGNKYKVMKESVYKLNRLGIIMFGLSVGLVVGQAVLAVL